METILSWIEVNAALVYILLFSYCALKSGALPLFAGILAGNGTLMAEAVLAATFLGGYLGDEIRFALGRRYGPGLGAGRPRLRRMMDRCRLLMDRHGALYIFLYRYPKGMRTIGALPVGMGTMPWSRFTRLNAASAGLWSVLLVGMGSLFGDSIQHLAETRWAAASIALLVLFVILTWILARRIGPGLLQTGR